MPFIHTTRSLAVVILTLLALFLTSISTSVAQTTARKMTAEELKNYQYIFKKTEPGVAYKLDLSHSQQRNIVQNKLKAFGKNKTNSPQLYKSLDRGISAGRGSLLGFSASFLAAAPKKETEAASTPQDLNIISDFNIISSSKPNTYTASALSSVVGGTKVTTIKLDIINLQDGIIYNTLTQQQYAQGTNFEVKLPATTTPANTQIDAVATITYTSNDDTSDTTHSYTVRASQMERPTQACMSAPNYCLRDPGGNCIQPVQHQTSCTNDLVSPAPVIVCYSRKSQQECDYYNKAPAHPTNFVFPVAGNVTYLTPLISPLSGTFTARLQDPSGGGACTLELQDQITTPNWTVNTAATTLSWSINPVSINDPTRCLNYVNGKKINLDLSATMNLNGTTPTGQQKIGHFRFTSDTNQAGQPGIYIIPMLDIEQGCIAEGAEIKLANGKQMVIEKFTADRSEVVMSGQKKDLTVLGTTKGMEMHPMKRIKTKNHNILLTKTHPVATPKGFVMASDLKKHDKIKTINGLETITAITDEKYKGKVYNLRVGTEADAKAGRSSFYANGILVGDSKTQSYYEHLEHKKLSSDPNHVAKRLPPHWRKDYRNHIAGK